MAPHFTQGQTGRRVPLVACGPGPELWLLALQACTLCLGRPVLEPSCRVASEPKLPPFKNDSQSCVEATKYSGEGKGLHADLFLSSVAEVAVGWIPVADSSWLADILMDAPSSFYPEPKVQPCSSSPDPS